MSAIQLFDLNGQERFNGTSVGGGGSQPVTVVLQAVAFDVHATGVDHPTAWTAALDNIWDSNHLAALPAGLGLTAAFDGSDATVTVTVAGVWALAYNIEIAAGDVSYVGSFSDSLGISNDLILFGRAALASDVGVGAVVTLPAGTAFAPVIRSAVSASNPQHATVTLFIARLA